jgi:hypothetical protein
MRHLASFSIISSVLLLRISRFGKAPKDRFAFVCRFFITMVVCVGFSFFHSLLSPLS